ncbi:PLDc N-terminal domain-containing protein [Corynebacterium sp. H127]|uniref:PLDc N-terminal domain-containing protein n=1 Tax=Corynebacterium sp. H127 TaxID=3133418 RepID=UPI0030B2AA4F
MSKDSEQHRKPRWADLSPAAKRLIIGLVTWEVLEKLVVWHFIYHTPKERTRGSKWMWFGLSLIDFFGPAAYALFGRKK